MRGETRQFWVEVDGLPDAMMKIASTPNRPTPSLLVEVDADALGSVKIFVTVPPGTLEEERTRFRFRVTSVRGAEATQTSAMFEAPKEAVR